MTSVDRAVLSGGRAGLAATACLRIRNLLDEVVGAGFVVGPGLVATCAHVIAEATGTDADHPVAPSMTLSVDFPIRPDGPREFAARVTHWVPVGADGRGDVALLRLDGATPPGVVMPPVRGGGSSWGHRFRVIGFPAGQDNGVWSTGWIRGEQGTGWFQLQGDPGDHPIVGGFSGSPVWDETTGAVIGMTVAADRAPDITTAFLVPISDVLGLDPELLPCPYRGFEPFDEEHADVFFGRAPELRRLDEAVRDSPLVAVTGPSGSGKSSLVNAGLVPHLRAHATPVARVTTTEPDTVDADLVGALLALTDPGSLPERRTRDAERIAEAMSRPTTHERGVAELVAAVDAVPNRVVLVLDQFEELVEIAPQRARDVLTLITALLADPGGPLRVVLTIRTPALDAMLTARLAEVLGSGTVLVGPLDPGRLREAVVGPAERAPGLAFEDGLVELIVADAGAGAAQLPLVESLLAELWRQRRGGTLTLTAYRTAGGVSGALARHAEHAVGAAVIGDEAECALADLLGRLVAISSDGLPMRRAVRYGELAAPARSLVLPLAAHRLVVLTGQSAQATVELAHLSLATHWPRLRDLIDADRAFLAWRTALDLARSQWEQAGRDDGALLRGTALTAAAAWDSRHDELASGDREFLDRSHAQQRRATRRRRWVLAALSSIVVVAVLLGLAVIRGADQTAQQRARDDAETLGRKAQDRADSDPSLAAELALTAWQLDPHDPAARAALADRYAATAATDGIAATLGDGTEAGLYSWGQGPSATLGIVAESATGGVQLSVVTGVLGEHPQRRELPVGVYTAILGSPDGRWLALPRRDGGLQVADLAAPTDRPPGRVATDGPLIGTPRFSPDATRLTWLTRDPAGRPVLHEYTAATGTVRVLDSSWMPPGTVSVSPVADPGLVLIRGPGGPTELRSLADGAVRRSFPSGTPVTAGRVPTAVTCTPAAPDSPTGPMLTTTDVTTGATRSTPLGYDLSCDDYNITTDGNYAVISLPSLAGRQQWRAVDLATGAVVQFSAPWRLPGSTADHAAPDMTLVMSPTGPVALVTAGSAALRIPTVPELPALAPTAQQVRVRTPHGQLGTDGQGFATVDPAGRPIATRPDVVTPLGRWYVHDGLWVIDRRGPVGRLTAYDLPGLTPRVDVPVDAPPGPAPRSSFLALVDGPDGRLASAITLAGGILSARDPHDGHRLGAPVVLPRTPTDTAWYSEHPLLVARHGHPGQVLVATPQNQLQLWDVPAGRMLLELPLRVTNPRTLTAAGDRLVAYTGDRTLDVWDLRTGTPTTQGLPFADGEELVGFTRDGQLVARGRFGEHQGQVVLYDLTAHTVTARMGLGITGDIRPEGGELAVPGAAGGMPDRLALDARIWHDRVCRTVPAQASAAARREMPDGVDPDTRCR